MSDFIVCCFLDPPCLFEVSSWACRDASVSNTTAPSVTSWAGAICHVMGRGNARQDIVHDDDDRRRLLDDLGRNVERSGWVPVALVVMTNHLHRLLKTPRPSPNGTDGPDLSSRFC